MSLRRELHLGLSLLRMPRDAQRLRSSGLAHYRTRGGRGRWHKSRAGSRGGAFYGGVAGSIVFTERLRGQRAVAWVLGGC